MKQFIYLDDIELNSLLAQFDEGLLTSMHQTTSVSNGQTSTAGINATTGLGVSSTKAEIDYQHSSADTASNLNGETHDVTWDDYAIDLLIEKAALTKSESLLDLDDGDLLLFDEKITRFDFDEVSRMLTSDSLSDIMKSTAVKTLEQDPDYANLDFNKQRKLSKKAENDSMKQMDDIKSVLKFGVDVLGGSPLFITSSHDGIAIGKKEKNRLSDAQMSMINGSKLNLTLLGIKRSTFDDSVLNLFLDGNDFKTKDLIKLPEFMQSVFFSHMGLLNNRGAFVEPIALYYDVPFETELA